MGRCAHRYGVPRVPESLIRRREPGKSSIENSCGDRQKFSLTGGKLAAEVIAPLLPLCIAAVGLCCLGR